MAGCRFLEGGADNDEEQWGPVVPVVAFDDLETPVSYVLASKYGQQVSVFGRDAETIGRLIAS